MAPNPSHKPAILAVLLSLLLACLLPLAMATTGGRMGGGFFSSDTSSSSRSQSDRKDDDRDWHHRSYSSYDSVHYPDRRCSSPHCDGHYPKEGNGQGSGMLVVLIIFAMVGTIVTVVYFTTEKKSVIKLQVGLSGKAYPIREKLNDISVSADTSTLAGLNHMLSETTLALLRHPDHWISAYSHVDQKWSMEDAEKCFKQLSAQERVKFEAETLVNVNNIKIQRTHIQKANRPTKDYIVVTILITAEGSYKVPAIKHLDDLKCALECLSSITSRKTLAVEVLWTPQEDNDTLSEHEVLENYPLLGPI